MTLPYERFRAVLMAQRFLRDLLDPSKTPRVPRVVRQMARAVLKHYPHEFEMEQAAKKAPKIWGEHKP